MPIRNSIEALRSFWDASAGARVWSASGAITVTLHQPVGVATVTALRDTDVFVTCPDPSIQRMLDSAQTGEIPAGTSIVLGVPRTPDRLVVVEDIVDLLSIPGAQTKEPRACVFFSTKEGSTFLAHVAGDDTPAGCLALARYHDAIRLWAVMEQQAQHVDAANGALLFFGLRRTEIQPGFTLADLTDDIAVQSISAFLSDEDRKTTRAEIFASVLSEFLRDLGPTACFRFLLRDSTRFARRLREGLAIYLAEHSPEKLAEEANAAAVGLSEKLEKVVAGIETKSLTVPAALLLAVKDVDQGAGMVATNVVIMSAAAAFTGTIFLVDRSQRSLLHLLRQTIESTARDFTKKGLDENNPVLGRTFDSLRKRCLVATRWSLLMFIASWVPLGCVVWTVFSGTPKPASVMQKPVPTSAPPAAPLPPVPAPTPGLASPVRFVMPVAPATTK